ncbi:MAG: LytR/AlgR family response regulator transcription factor [Saprospiraceae bacterium]
MKAILIDDELHSLETTELLIENFCPQVTIIGIANNAERGIKLINKLKPDLVFLDISMPKMNGFELLNHLEYQQFELIFTTAYDKYAIQAFQVGAIHYLLKPIDTEELIKAVERVEKKITQQQTPDLQSIIQQVSANRQPKIVIPSQKGLELIEVDTIIRCEADSNYSIIYLIAHKIVVTKTLKELEQLLEYHNFIRIHHSHLINLRHLKAYLKGEGGEVILSNGEHINVSRSRKSRLLEKLELL